MSDQLAELELRLRQTAANEPTPPLRDRVMQAVAKELALSKTTRGNFEISFWLWPAVAASIMVVLNLSFLSASRNEFMLQPAMNDNTISVELHAMQSAEAQQKGFLK